MKIEINISQIQSLVLQLDLIINYTSGGKKLNHTDLTYLAYLKLHGYPKGKDLTILDGVSLSKQSWANKISTLKKKGIITKSNELHPNIYTKLGDFEYNINFKIKENV